MIHPSDISKDFILNKAVRDATNILLRPYMSSVLTESSSTSSNYENKFEVLYQFKDRWITHSHDFLIKMASIAWDFLNILNMFQNNLANQNIEDDIPSNNI